VSETFAFDVFELDTARFELRRDGHVQEAQPKVLRLLEYLIRHRERAVSGEELLRELWPEATVTSGSVKRAVLGARQALGDTPDGSSTSIRTVRGLGYQFVRDDVRVLPVASPVSPPAAVSGSSGGLFLGRDALLAALSSQLEAASTGRGGCVLLTGAPGIGKTRTAEELWSRARARGAHVWLGRCTALHGAPSLWPVQQALRDALRELGASRLRELLGTGSGEIARAIPELQLHLGELPKTAALSTRSERFRLFDSFSVFLRSVAEQRPVVLGFDDLQYADESTLQLLAFLVRQLGSARLSIIGTFRRDATSAALDELVREEHTRCIELSGFDHEALSQYVVESTGVQLPAETLRELHARTAGNPLFVRQLMESWRSSEALSLEALEQAAHSLDLRGAIQRHLEVLPDDCHGLLRAAAVLGKEFSSATLASILGRPLAEVWASLSQAEAMQLIEPSAEHGRFRFAHSLICDALYRQLPLAERARLHGRAGDALEAHGIGNDHVLLAEATRHFVAAVPAHDAGRALSFTLRAADNALSRLAYEEAAAHFDRALQLQQYAAPDPLARMSLLLRRAEALARTSQLTTARVALFDVIALAREHAQIEVAYSAATLLAEQPESGAVDTEQLSALRYVMASLPAQDERRVLLQAAIAKSLSYSRERKERSELATVAWQRSKQLVSLPLRTAVLTRCHEALLGPEHLQERVLIAADLMMLAQQSGEPAQLLRASATQIETCIERGDMEAVERAVGAMETLADYVREPYFRWHAKALRATQAFVHGQIRLAEQRAREAFASGAPLGEALARHLYCAQVVGMFQLQSRMHEAEPLAREMALRYPGIAGWSARVGIIDHGLGRIDAARRCLGEIMARQREWLKEEPFALSGLCSIAELCGWVADPNAAQVMYAELSPYAAHIGLTHLGAAVYGPVHRLLGWLSAVSLDLPRAEKHFEASLQISKAMRSPTYWSVTAVTYAELLAVSGGASRRGRAATLLRKSLMQAEQCDFTAVTEYARGLIQRHNLSDVRRDSEPLES
jgi:DNA-binding winged helix-turn-helix (wHTH) protein